MDIQWSILERLADFPVMRQQICQANSVIVAVVWDLCQHSCQPLPWIYNLFSTETGQVVQYDPILGSIMIATKHIVTASRRRGQDGILIRIIICLVTVVVDIQVHQ